MAGITTDNPGKSFPLGAAVCPDGVNFSIFSKHSTAVDLLLFERVDDPKPSRVVALDPRTNRTYHYWHTFVPGVKTGQLYAYRVRGPYAPERGLRFDPDKVLLDPYGKCVARPPGYSRQAACHRGDNAAVAIKSVVADPSTYDWEGDSPPEALRQDGGLRDACGRLHQASQLRHCGRPAGHLCRTGGKSPILAGPWSHRGRIAPRLRL